MWKLILAFALFAAVALWLISKGGGSVDMSGEKHGADVHGAESSAPAAASAASN